MAATAVTLCGIELENPIIPASGTFGYGQEFAQLYDINMLGTFSFKGTTRAPRFGNPTPRIAEYAGGMLNAVGLQNPGVDAVIAHELPELKKVFHKPVMANVSGFSVEEYAEVCARLDAQPQVGWLEVNISCPNVHGGGAAFGAEPSAAAEVTRAVRAVTKKPIILKLSPTAADIAAVAKACEDAGADGVSLINTLPGMRIDLARRRPLLIAVTQLTSTDQERMDRELLIHAPIDEVVLHYARNARDAGLDGVVCSPLEAGSIHARCGADFLTVTPGVRFADGESGDQKRVTTPERAREIGSDYIVVGRPITQADDPVAAYRRCVAAFVG